MPLSCDHPLRLRRRHPALGDAWNDTQKAAAKQGVISLSLLSSSYDLRQAAEALVCKALVAFVAVLRSTVALGNSLRARPWATAVGHDQGHGHQDAHAGSRTKQQATPPRAVRFRLRALGLHRLELGVGVGEARKQLHLSASASATSKADSMSSRALPTRRLLP